jgi:DNA-binding NarL/FixJ family response regulator
VTVPCRALIVDDDEDMAFLTAFTLELASPGFTVAGVASSGEEALRLLPDAEADVVVLDFRMPGRNGLDVAKDILSLKPDQMIVLFSAFLDSATVAAAEVIGIQECVSKSRLKDLAAVVRSHCPAV